MRMAIAILAVCLCSTLHAQEAGAPCTPPADQYIGILIGDGRCMPWRKDQEKFFSTEPRCTAELKAGHFEYPMFKVINGDVVFPDLECVPDELRYRPSPPQSPSLLDLQRNIDELKDEIERLKQERQ
jgi:hypothetical protein